ncbi:MAG: hypothetical protein SRB1_01246 [Desulfobacteraceae bacterium Eth-SRB1]|uniref:HicB-like antitoxin of toxin-antitoxin system domain-containing protein n=1 Tax=Candidatus Argoarchaeum ethanivorans TaxID=2608793 RepID=A0A8B3RZH1_9EURY|nr:MAG: hypothetical protein AEth_01943 [Candidatus Argoarchaeum ethanivorans]RZB32953.1 MAG: hypothetical protein SRB1_01246 [Desulfobacteraceae bacterium Eth-SRB1]
MQAATTEVELTLDPLENNHGGLKQMQRYRISVVIEKDVDGYFAFCSELQGCYTQGDNYEEVLENIRDAIRIHIEDRGEIKKITFT